MASAVDCMYFNPGFLRRNAFEVFPPPELLISSTEASISETQGKTARAELSLGVEEFNILNSLEQKLSAAVTRSALLRLHSHM